MPTPSVTIEYELNGVVYVQCYYNQNDKDNINHIQHTEYSYIKTPL